MKKNRNQKINKKAFTLIELLAVLVILAIIALIAVPIILGIVEGTRKDAFVRSTELIVSSLDLDMGLNQYLTKTYTMEDGVIPDLKVGINNTKGISGSVFYGETGIAEYALHNDTWCVMKSKEMEKATVVKYKEGSCTLEDIMELPKVSIQVKKTSSKEDVVNNAWSNELVTIILKDENEKTEGNKLYYCVDTNNTCNPDKEIVSEEETPIENTGEMYIRYKIVNSIGVESNIGSFHVQVDNIVPEVEITAKKTTSQTEVENDEWSNELLMYTLTATKEGGSGSSISYCVDTENSCTPSNTVTSGVAFDLDNTGTYYVRYSITSGAGTSSTTIGSYKAKVDIEKPSVSNVTVAETQNTDDTKTVTITGQDNAGGSGVAEYCLTNQDNNSPCEWTASSQFKKGEGTYYAFIKDNAGNISITIDTSKVEIELAKLLLESFKEKIGMPEEGQSIQSGNNGILKNEGEYGIRFEGKDPNNYVSFNEEIWRIIGIVDGKVKIIRNESLGKFVWDDKNGNGIFNYGEDTNNWSDATLQKLLNGDYYNSTGTYADNKGIKAAYKTMINTATIWSLLGNHTSEVTKADMYNIERTTGKVENDSKPKKIPDVVHKGPYPIGLMYPSDYGFAVKESDQCPATQTLYDYDDEECINNNWLFNGDWQWTITGISSGYYDEVFLVSKYGNIYYNNYWSGALRSQGVRPVLNLTSNVKITGGTGEIGSPYTLAIG